MSNKRLGAGKLQIEEKFSVQIKSDLKTYLLDGWAVQAPDILWTVGDCASLQLHLSGLGTQNIVLRMECSGFLASGKLDNQSVEVLVNDNKVATWTVRRKAWHEAVVPNELLATGDMTVNLLINNPAAPFDYNMSDDKRKLGIRVSSMELFEAGEVDPEAPAVKIMVTAPNIDNARGKARIISGQGNTDSQADKQVVTRNAIWITSYPKSGNTWVHSVLRLAGKNYGFPQVDMDAYNILRKGGQPIICPAVNDRLADPPPVVLKTHSVYKKVEPIHCFAEIELKNTAYIHIYRNPLDVLLSYINFTKIEYKDHADSATYKKDLFEDMLGLHKQYEYEEWMGMNLDAIPQNNLDHALNYFSDNGLSLQRMARMSGSWIDHTQSWFDAAHDMPGHSIRYEDCLEDSEQFVKLCDLFKFDRKDVLSALDYVNSRARSMSTSGDQYQSVFFNKMSAYYFTDYFSKDAISRFLNKHEVLLKDCGYAQIFDLV